MPRLEKERFGLLEEVKTVNIGNDGGDLKYRYRNERRYLQPEL